MPSIYLQQTDYATFGLSTETTEAQVIEASAIIDGYLNKPDGLIYTELETMEATGLLISKITATNKRNIVQLDYTPARFLTSLEYNIRGAYTPPLFNSAVLSDAVLLEDGQLYLPPVMCPYTLVKISYIAGYLYSELPYQVKQACASIVEIIQEGIVSGAVSRLKAGGSEVDYNISDRDDSLYIDVSVASMLAPFRRVYP
jgi:hypothetical protein